MPAPLMPPPMTSRSTVSPPATSQTLPALGGGCCARSHWRSRLSLCERSGRAPFSQTKIPRLHMRDYETRLSDRTRGGGHDHRRVQGIRHLETNAVLLQQELDRGWRIAIGEERGDLGDAAEPDHRVAAEFGRIGDQEDLPGIGDDLSRDAHLVIVEIEQRAIAIDA